MSVKTIRYFIIKQIKNQSYPFYAIEKDYADNEIGAWGKFHETIKSLKNYLKNTITKYNLKIPQSESIYEKEISDMICEYRIF